MKGSERMGFAGVVMYGVHSELLKQGLLLLLPAITVNSKPNHTFFISPMSRLIKTALILLAVTHKTWKYN